MQGIPSPLKSFSGKLLIIFFIASFLPSLFITIISKSYVAQFVEEETRSNLAKHAKSYALLTFDKLLSLSSLADSTKTDRQGNIIGKYKDLFVKIETYPILNFATAGFSASQKPKLSYFFDENNNVFFKIEKFIAKRDGKLEIRHITIPAVSLFGNENSNPFSEPTCVITHHHEVLYCTQDVEVDRKILNFLHHSDGGHSRNNNITFGGSNYWLVSWELFLPTYFQSKTWDFVIIKPENVLLSSLKRFENFLVPVAMLFFLIISYFVYKLSIRLLAPLTQLVSATKKIEKGNFQVNLNLTSDDEFSELAASFNSMSSNLLYESQKNIAFSKLDESVLYTANLQDALKKNIPEIISIIDADQLIISIARPDDVSTFDAYSCINTKDSSPPVTEHFTHTLNYAKKPTNSLYVLSLGEFKERFETVKFNALSTHAWIKEIECHQKIVGFIFLFTNQSQLAEKSTYTLIDLSERLSILYTTHKQQSDLHKKAHFDDLTLLPNRSYLLSKLQTIINKQNFEKLSFAILYIDLDLFKNVNDLAGHAVGNKVLIEVADRLKICAGEDAFVSRISGDEFCIIATNLSNTEEPELLANTILMEFNKPFDIADTSYFLGASIGIAVNSGQISKPDTLLENADLAMFKAKQLGRNQYVVFDSEIERERNERLSLERQLHFALESNEVSLNFQPKFEMQTGRLVSAEALARWNHTDLGPIRTDVFISLAEESGLINEIGEWILKKSCYQYLDWIDKGIEIESIAVNVSARQLASKRFSEIVKSTLRETRMPAQCLELEITESAFIHDEKFLIGELNKLHNLGLKISIDDFGKEYSSLNYLKKIPFDTLKIDREFIMDIDKDVRDQHIVEVIINIGHTMKKKIVAEGIETKEQCDLLRAMSCDYGQGFLYSRPLSDIEFLEFIVNESADKTEMIFKKIEM